MGHLKPADQIHGAHAGDMSSLLVKGNGTATLRLTTDRFTLADLRDADGSAVMVHAGPDNFANIPRALRGRRPRPGDARHGRQRFARGLR